jgi:hypothetical protein
MALGNHNERNTMTKRLQRLLVAVAALAAMALGGAVLAQAQTSPTAAHERTSVPDRDNVQSGDQTTPDTAPKAATVRHAATIHAHQRAGRVVARGTETPGAETSETGAGSESAPGNDGPGGHADEPGNANADHQYQGNE